MGVGIWPAWPLQFDDLFLLAVALLVGALSGEGVARFARLPRVTGYSLAGLVMGPLLFGWFDQQDVDRVRVLIDLALALLLFEIGVRLDVRWFRANPWVLAASLAEAALTFLLTYLVLRALGLGNGVAATVSAIVIGTSPAVVMRVAAEMRAEGQVTQRLFALCALNVAYSVALFRLVVGGMHGVFLGDWVLAVLHPLYQILGSLLVGGLFAWVFAGVRRHLDLSDEQGVLVLFGLLLLTLALLKMLMLPPLLAPLVAGAVVKYRDPRPQLWPRHFGTAGGVLAVALFMLTGLAMTWPQFLAGAAVALAVSFGRVAGKLGGALALGPASGLSMRQSVSLGVALLPMSALSFVLALDLEAMYPDFATQVVPIVFSMMTVMELLGPVAVQWSLQWVGEHAAGGR